MLDLWAVAGSPLLLGLDVGTSRLKAQLMDEEGGEVGSSAAATPFRSLRDRVEMEVGALWSTLAQVVDDLGDAAGRVVGVGITGMAESGAPLDRGGEPLAPVIAWHDPRGAEAVALLEARFGDELPRRIGQRLRTVSSVAKLGWSLSQGVAGVGRWLGVPELCLFALTGAQASDHSLAARTGCYDIAARAWWPEVAAALGIAGEVFPPVRPAGAVMGRVSAPGASWSGLPVGVPVTLAGHDHLAALAGAGAGPGDFGNSVGTAETVVATTDELPDVERALALRVAVTLRPEGDGWALLAGAARAGRVIDTVSTELGLSPVDLDARAQVAGVVDATDLLASVLGDGRSELPPGSPGEVWNGILRALAGRTWEAVARASALVGPPSRLVVFGGGSRSRPWLGAKAAMGEHRGVTVWRSRAGEAAARGAALQAGVAAGWWSSPAQAPPPGLEEVVAHGAGRAGSSVGPGADPGDGHDGDGDGGAQQRQDHEHGW